MRHPTSALFFTIGCIILLAGICLPGPPFPEDWSTRILAIMSTLGLLGLGGLVILFALWLDDGIRNSQRK